MSARLAVLITLMGVLAPTVSAQQAGPRRYPKRPAEDWVRELADPRERLAAFEALVEQGAQALPALKRGLGDRSEDVRSSCASALGRLGAEGKPALKALVALGEVDKSLAVKLAVITAVGKIGELTPGVQALVMAGLADPSPVLRARAAMVAEGFAKDSPELVKALVKRWDAADPAEKLRLAGLFGRLGSGAATAVPVLVKSLADPKLGGACASALGHIGGSAVGAVRPLLAASEAPVRARAAKIIGAAGEAAAQASRELAGLLDDEDPLVRVEATLALAAAGEAGVRAAARRFAADNRRLRLSVAQVFAEAGTASRAAPEELVALVGDEDAAVRRAALKAARHCVTEVPALHKPLVARLEDDESGQRAMAAAALGELGAKAKDDLARLEALATSDRSTAVRDAARAAADKIREAVKAAPEDGPGLPGGALPLPGE